MAKKRTTHDIVRDMLELARDGIRKTNLMIGARISFDLLKKYLSLLESADLVKEENRIIRLTPKGAVTLQLLNRLNLLEREEEYLRRKLSEMIPGDVEDSLETMKRVLDDTGIPYDAEGDSLMIGKIEICKEIECGKSIFVDRPRIKVGKKFLVYSDGKSVKVIKNNSESLKKMFNGVQEE
ncbi:hypothetical protein L3N51_01924 [Metallosphaera sp. J1]|uniref:winged helix-turn-helix domain-containing protein n=1 Tax=Metallosphaera javensis (ex Hofmann et al. 2022) TaxID=99938 RepID=UPI001EDEFF23|nr:winged helix-turn-helix domain-containing protein [Metallosphaera javensis (ex Hofmann et al. 2022)]MCG3109629.1 hypothetical protein [Metallosphaera javensis (ex Hofmann et al. 2022)]